MLELLIDRTDLRNARIEDASPPALAAGAIRLRLELFSLTANNITYAALGGGKLGYWDFFPAPAGWGKPPCWGFATVVQSRAAEVAEGRRFYGYFPIAESFDALPVRAGPRGFTDGAPHRAHKAGIYNLYFDTAHDPAYDAAFEPEQSLWRPLYATGWWAAECVGADDPRSVVMSSASAKTALAMAHQLRRRGAGALIALTSERNRSFVEATGLHHAVTTYNAAARLHAEAPATFVDFLGREELLQTVHQALGAQLARSILIGAADWSGQSDPSAPPRTDRIGPKPEFFFVPTYAAQRLQEDPGLNQAMLQDLRAFYPASRGFVEVRRLAGASAILESWDRLAQGAAAAHEGLVAGF